MTDIQQTEHDMGFVAHLERLVAHPLVDGTSVLVDVHDVQLAIETIRRLMQPRP